MPTPCSPSRTIMITHYVYDFYASLHFFFFFAPHVVSWVVALNISIKQTVPYLSRCVVCVCVVF